LFKLLVNVDHVATVREARKAGEPDPVAAAVLADLGGADGIIVHLREDRRHIQDRDLRILREIVRTKLNLEMAATQEMLQIALEVKPDMVTLVPEKREELTTEGGLEVQLNQDHLRKFVQMFKDAGILVSFFIDPEPDQVKASHILEADFVEIHTGTYADATTPARIGEELGRIVDSVKLAHRLKLRVNAGHGLNYNNIFPLLELGEIEEFSIGHSIVARSVLVGFEAAVREMVNIVRFAKNKSDSPPKRWLK
jgi:pyridoxine 5-phosphate synthase